MSDMSIVAIIPLYNGARWIEDTLRSVFAQTLQPDEIVVIDDGSTDGGKGAAIVARLAQERPIMILRKENGGQASARNRGVAASASALIAFLDQDDVWYPQHLETLLKPFQRDPGGTLGWVYSNLDITDSDGWVTRHMGLHSFRSAIVHPKKSIRQCLADNCYILPSASLISRRAFDAVGGFDETFIGFEDDDLFVRIFNAGYRNVYIDAALSQWRMHPGSTTHMRTASRAFIMDRSRRLYAHKLAKNFPAQRLTIVYRFSRSALARGYRALGRRDIPDAWRSGVDLLDVLRLVF